MQRLAVDLEKNATELSPKVFNPPFNNTCPGRSASSSCRLGNGGVIKGLNMSAARCNVWPCPFATLRGQTTFFILPS